MYLNVKNVQTYTCIYTQEEQNRIEREQALRREMDTLESRLAEIVRSNQQERQRWMLREEEW